MRIISGIYFLLMISLCYAQKTYVNPVIPGDHPDPTLTKIGKYFYTSGSSFNPTPKIYRSTDLVHWEVIAQPVSASWSEYGNSPGGGIWGGHMVYYKNYYWHFFGRNGVMYFVKAEKPEGPWSMPVRMKVPAGMSGLGMDNSIFIDDDGKWYLLTKNGKQNNHIVELGDDGQPTGRVLDLTWLNPDSEGNPYDWAEGPVMWKYKGYYYYSFAQHLAGSQYVMRSDTLTDDKSAWTIIGTNIFTGPVTIFATPNHISPAVMLDDSTSWVIAHSYYNSSWYAQGRQGLLCQVIYDENGFPKILRPSMDAVTAPNLPSSGIPWAVPHSDYFDSEKLHPEWSFLGYTPDNTYTLTERPGWLKLSVIGRSGRNTVIKNDGEHNYSLITKLDFEPESITHEAGLWIINGPQTLQVKVYSSVNNEGKKIIGFSFKDTKYEVENTIGSILWLKLVRNEHMMSGYYSSNGYDWIKIGQDINAAEIDKEVTQFNNFTGNYQGLYTIGKHAYFDLYIYRDAYTPISAWNPANHYGIKVLSGGTQSSSLTDIQNNDWAMYAGVEFGNKDYPKIVDSLFILASCNSTGGVVEVYIDSLDGEKIAECNITNTGGTNIYKVFKTKIDKEVKGMHDVYLKFVGSVTKELFRLRTITFKEKLEEPTSMRSNTFLPDKFYVYQNYPNPFNPSTTIKYNLPAEGEVNIKIYDIQGKEIIILFKGFQKAGTHFIHWNGKNKDGYSLPSGVYLSNINYSGNNSIIKLLLIK